MTKHLTQTSIEFIDNLSFEFIETFSFQRGFEFEQSSKKNRSEYQKLKAKKVKRNNLSESENERFNELDRLCGYTQYLINENGQFHSSSIKTHRFKSTDPETLRLISILKSEIIETPNWMCAPIYRDAIVFYDNSNQIISALNICLSCESIETRMFHQISTDIKTYQLLRQFFIDLGHNVEEK